jgi:hypothetical protein
MAGTISTICRCPTKLLYYSAEILHTVHEIATGKRKAERHEAIPVVHLPPTELVPVT